MKIQQAHGARKENGMEKVKVRERALIGRINRKLAKMDSKLKTCRESSPSYSTLGRYYVVDVNRNFVQDHDVDLEALGRDLGVLKGYEEIDE